MNRVPACLMSVLLLLVLLSFGTRADEPQLTMAARSAEPDSLDQWDLELKAFVDGYITARMHDRQVVGITVSIVRDGKRVLSRGYGFDDLETHRYVDSSRSLFRPGSISKTFTWTALMQLYEQGKVKLDTDIQEYLPQIELPNNFDKPITILDLMAHRPGFEDSAAGHLIIDRPERVQTLVEYLQTHQPAQVYPPGSTPAYSNYGVGLAGLIVANVSGQPFEDYAEEHLFKPLGMINTTFREPWGDQRPDPMPEEMRQNASKGFIRKGAVFESTPYEFIGHVGPAGAIATTADDMALWMLAHLGNGAVGDARILKAETAALMHTQHQTTDPRLPGLAHGFIETHLHGYRAYGHGGGTAHFLSDMEMVPELDLGIFISTNTSDGGGRLINGFARDFIRRFYPPGPLLPDEVEVATEPARQDVAGSWLLSRRSHNGVEKIVAPVVEVAFNPEGDLILSGAVEPSRFTAAGVDHFRNVDDPDAQLIFVRDEAGNPQTLLTSIPIFAGTRPGHSDQPAVKFGILGFGVIVFIGVLLLAWRRMGRGLLYSDAERRAAIATTLASALWLLAIGLFVAGADGMNDPRNALFHFPTPAILAALWMILAALTCTLIALPLSITAMQAGTWSGWRRLRHAIVLISAVLVALVMWQNNLVGFNYF